METKTINLGKVCLTVDGTYDSTKDYDKLCMVSDEETDSTYISKKFVPKNTPIDDEEYWQFLFKNNSVDYTINQLEEDFNEIFGI